MQDAADEGRAGVDELEVVFLEQEVGVTWVQAGDQLGGCGPEDVVVVGEVGEEDSEEETCCCDGCQFGGEGKELVGVVTYDR